MRFCLAIFLFITNTCCAQRTWLLEVMPGVTGYAGDLTQSALPLRTLGPGININLKYDSKDMFVFRTGIAWGMISGNDKYNSHADIRNRNLNFKSFIWEVNVCAEFNFFDPEINTAYPYLFGGIGLFRFNPYTFDSTNTKRFLRPLSTEGEGLSLYPNRKEYSLIQPCLPFGIGFKINMKDKYYLSFEFGMRYLFTDYLDDVSKTYISPEALLAAKGPIAKQLAFRSITPVNEGDIRGNSKKNDTYAFAGAKLSFFLGKKKDKKTEEEKTGKKTKKKK